MRLKLKDDILMIRVHTEKKTEEMKHPERIKGSHSRKARCKDCGLLGLLVFFLVANVNVIVTVFIIGAVGRSAHLTIRLVHNLAAGTQS